jgi:holo-[acyl-carrier protein] synthase
VAIAGIGTDIVRVERFNQFIQRQNEALLQRMFTLAELDYALPRKCAGQHLAARFAAKESFVKALGLGLRDGITWHDMEVVRDDLGCPALKLSGRAAEIMLERQLNTTFLSYSHEVEYAIATVVLERI